MRKKEVNRQMLLILLYVPGCTSSLRTQFVEDAEEPEVLLNSNIIHIFGGGGSKELTEVTYLVESTRWLIKERFKTNLCEPIRLVRVHI